MAVSLTKKIFPSQIFAKQKTKKEGLTLCKKKFFSQTNIGFPEVSLIPFSTIFGKLVYLGLILPGTKILLVSYFAFFFLLFFFFLV